MSSNDLTQNQPTEAATKPTLETVLERINSIGDALTQRMDEILQGLTTVSANVAQLRNDMEQGLTNVSANVAQLRHDTEQGFRKVERKIEILNDNLLTIQANHRDLLVRVEDLEKVS